MKTAAPAQLSHYLNSRISGSELRTTRLPQCPELRLWLLNEDYPQWQLNQEQVEQLMDNPPYWAFCWASGQVLARYLLDHPHFVTGKSVVDFGSGSGVVAIAAKLAGATTATACDTDPVAIQAGLENAELNAVSIHTVDHLDAAPAADIVTVADVFYDSENLPLLASLRERFDNVWVADSRLKGQTLDGLNIIDSYTSHTVPDLDESNEFNTVNLYKTQ